jgi:hypothetical protein
VTKIKYAEDFMHRTMGLFPRKGIKWIRFYIIREILQIVMPKW